jgi:hypothetical protein
MGITSKSDFSPIFPAMARVLMPPNADVAARFTGYVPVTSGLDNKIWNAWVAVDFSATPQVDHPAYYCHGCPYPGPAQWSLFDMNQKSKTDPSGTASVNVRLNHCQTGIYIATCSTSSSPPAVADPASGSATLAIVLSEKRAQPTPP